MTDSRKNQALKIDSRDWHQVMADVILADGDIAYPKSLVRALCHVVPFDYSVWFIYRGDSRPVCVYDTFTRDQRVIFVEDYQDGPYLLDPFYIACADKLPRGLYRLRDIAPDRFYHSEYFRSYYRRTRLAEEIAFLTPLGEGTRLSISLMRDGRGRAFSDRDLNKLKRIEPIVYASVLRQWNDDHDFRDHYVELGHANGPVGAKVSDAFENFGKGTLTARECEIVRMVLRGHSSESIGRHCGITTGTVKIHRKNIYAKLGISTQSELFSLFISEL